MTEDKKVRTMPKGGRKGGAVFPRITLGDALIYARKLVSKTHVSPQSRDIIYSGVVGAKSGKGNVRISALKQYGFLKGDNKDNYSADDLAKRINSSPEAEVIPLYREAALKPVIFKKIFDTFHGDDVSRSKLKQRAADLNVHPDETDTCADLYIATMATAKLVSVDGDRIIHLNSIDLLNLAGGEGAIEGEKKAGDDGDIPADDIQVEETEPGLDNVSDSEVKYNSKYLKPKAVFNVNISIDASMDVEKLQKQLELLRRYGAI